MLNYDNQTSRSKYPINALKEKQLQKFYTQYFFEILHNNSFSIFAKNRFSFRYYISYTHQLLLYHTIIFYIIDTYTSIPYQRHDNHRQTQVQIINIISTYIQIFSFYNLKYEYLQSLLQLRFLPNNYTCIHKKQNMHACKISQYSYFFSLLTESNKATQLQKHRPFFKEPTAQTFVMFQLHNAQKENQRKNKIKLSKKQNKKVRILLLQIDRVLTIFITN
eukprot:TRINITY_DN4494_c1_g1_i1.p1 TRINITY_DN4494_c1_g1~~TRINITY_DN4494_c1_g1_i1.p1  ORF type:complete len:257 (-),score=3.28 TRINITY_DN4494_c1_g1_i1:570-1229(-)